MTHLPRYSLTVPGRKTVSALTLYEARKALLAVASEGVEMAPVVVRTVDRNVAYYSGWTETVRPMFEALDEERSVLLSWEGPQAKAL